MKKTIFDSKFREYVKQHIALTETEKSFVSKIYQSFQNLLDTNKTLQIGSYSRFTAIRPLHDLDILYILGNWNEQNHNPDKALKELLEKIKKEYLNPTSYKIEQFLQTHSVTIVFKNNSNEKIFSVDIIPAYISSQNEFQQDTYKVPEVLRKKYGDNRAEFYKKLSQEQKEMDWIKTDPRGYIEIAKQLNQENSDFRKTVKFIKAWKNSCKDKYEDFKIKSFHIEQVITKYFQEKTDLEIFDIIFKFFVEIPQIIEAPKIKDRANNDKYIDDYLNALTDEQREKIIQARDCFLIKLENFSENETVENLIKVCFYQKQKYSESEQYLFDFKIPILTDKNFYFEIEGFLKRKDGYREYKYGISQNNGKIDKSNNIKFRIKGERPNVDLFKWKVKNDNNSEQPRGEITDTQTHNDPEHTQYIGNHYVECYAILNNICVAKARQNVILE
jgi:hypothetical protein